MFSIWTISFIWESGTLFSYCLVLKMCLMQSNLYCFHRDFMKGILPSASSPSYSFTDNHLIEWFLIWGAIKMWWWVAAESIALKDNDWKHVLGPGAWLLWQCCCSAKAVSHCGWKEAPLPATTWVSGSWRKCWNDALPPQMRALRLFI